MENFVHHYSRPTEEDNGNGCFYRKGYESDGFCVYYNKLVRCRGAELGLRFDLLVVTKNDTKKA
jgi:hypothetical protein